MGGGGKSKSGRLLAWSAFQPTKWRFAMSIARAEPDNGTDFDPVLDAEVIELLPSREELALVVAPRITVFGAVVQNNIALTFGSGNFVNQVNTLTLWFR
jgi:hypothetical protein